MNMLLAVTQGMLRTKFN